MNEVQGSWNAATRQERIQILQLGVLFYTQEGLARALGTKHSAVVGLCSQKSIKSPKMKLLRSGEQWDRLSALCAQTSARKFPDLKTEAGPQNTSKAEGLRRNMLARRALEDKREKNDPEISEAGQWLNRRILENMGVIEK